MSNWITSGTLGFITGGAFIWFFKIKIQSLVISGNKLSAKLHAQADALRK